MKVIAIYIALVALVIAAYYVLYRVLKSWEELRERRQAELDKAIAQSERPQIKGPQTFIRTPLQEIWQQPNGQLILYQPLNGHTQTEYCSFDALGHPESFDAVYIGDL